MKWEVLEKEQRFSYREFFDKRYVSIRLFVRLFTQIAAFQTLRLIRYYFSYRNEVSSRYFFLPSFRETTPRGFVRVRITISPFFYFSTMEISKETVASLISLSNFSSTFLFKWGFFFFF